MWQFREGCTLTNFGRGWELWWLADCLLLSGSCYLWIHLLLNKFSLVLQNYNTDIQSIVHHLKLGIANTISKRKLYPPPPPIFIIRLSVQSEPQSAHWSAHWFYQTTPWATFILIILWCMFLSISPSIMNRFPCSFTQAIFKSYPNVGRNLYWIFQKLDHLTCNKILELV